MFYNGLHTSVTADTLIAGFRLFFFSLRRAKCVMGNFSAEITIRKCHLARLSRSLKAPALCCGRKVGIRGRRERRGRSKLACGGALNTSLRDVVTSPLQSCSDRKNEMTAAPYTTHCLRFVGLNVSVPFQIEPPRAKKGSHPRGPRSKVVW